MSRPLEPNSVKGWVLVVTMGVLVALLLGATAVLFGHVVGWSGPEDAFVG